MFCFYHQTSAQPNPLVTLTKMASSHICLHVHFPMSFPPHDSITLHRLSTSSCSSHKCPSSLSSFTPFSHFSLIPPPPSPLRTHSPEWMLMVVPTRLLFLCLFSQRKSSALLAWACVHKTQINLLMWCTVKHCGVTDTAVYC